MDELILTSALFFLIGVMFAFTLVEALLHGKTKLLILMSALYILIAFSQLRNGIEASDAYIAISVLIVFNVAYLLLRMRGRKVGEVSDEGS